jgi:hypothetical protein
VVAKILKPFAAMLKQDSPKIWVFGKVTGKRAQFTFGKSDITFQQVITHDQASKGKAQPEYLMYTEGVDFELTDSSGAKNKFRRFTVTSDFVDGVEAMIKFCVNNIAKNPSVLTRQKFSVFYDSKKKPKFALISKGSFKMIADVDPSSTTDPKALVPMLARWIGGKQLSVGDRFYSSETDLGKLFEKHTGKRNHKLQKLAIQQVMGMGGVIDSVVTDDRRSFQLLQISAGSNRKSDSITKAVFPPPLPMLPPTVPEGFQSGTMSPELTNAIDHVNGLAASRRNGENMVRPIDMLGALHNLARALDNLSLENAAFVLEHVEYIRKTCHAALANALKLPGAFDLATEKAVNDVLAATDHLHQKFGIRKT